MLPTFFSSNVGAFAAQPRTTVCSVRVSVFCEIRPVAHDDVFRVVPGPPSAPLEVLFFHCTDSPNTRPYNVAFRLMHRSEPFSFSANLCALMISSSTTRTTTLVASARAFRLSSHALFAQWNLEHIPGVSLAWQACQDPLI